MRVGDRGRRLTSSRQPRACFGIVMDGRRGQEYIQDESPALSYWTMDRWEKWHIDTTRTLTPTSLSTNGALLALWRSQPERHMAKEQPKR